MTALPQSSLFLRCERTNIKPRVKSLRSSYTGLYAQSDCARSLCRQCSVDEYCGLLAPRVQVMACCVVPGDAGVCSEIRVWGV